MKSTQKKRGTINRIINQTAIIGVCGIFLGMTIGGPFAFGAESPGTFYRGKTLTLYVSNEAGSSIDLMARSVAPFLAKELDAIVKVEDKGISAGTNYVYNQATRDGLSIGVNSSSSMIDNDILKAPGVQYETEKFNFVVDLYPTVKVVQISPKLPSKTLEYLRKAKGLKVGGTTAKGSIALCGAVMLEILGLDGKVITGYQGKKSLNLAMARGELDFMVTSENTAMNDEKDGYVINLLVTADKRSVVIPQVPTLREAGVKVPKELQPVLNYITNSGFVLFLPPAVPQEKVDHLRKVFQNRLNNNKELQKVIEKLSGGIKDFGTGEEIQKEMAEIKADKEIAPKLDRIFKKYSAVQ